MNSDLNVTPAELNQNCIDRLRSATQVNCMAVIGSGPSSPYIAPINELQRQLSSRCRVRRKPAGEYFWAFCDRAHDKDQDEYYCVLRETYGATPHWSANIYEHLVNIQFCGFATLNYDNQLPSAFERKYPESKHFSVYPPFGGQHYWKPQEFRSQPPRLIALHGYCNPNNSSWEKQVVLRTADYNQHYTEATSPLFDWWVDMLLAIPCIFLGTSLQEPGLFRVVKYLCSDQQHKERLDQMNHLHLIGAPIAAPKYPTPEKTFGFIEQIYFDPKDEHYTGLVEILGSLSGIPVDTPSPRAPVIEPITPTDDFPFPIS